MRVFVENAAGSMIKNSYDEQSLTLLRSDPVSSPYPFAYGFVLDTLSGDGDCLDCFVITEKPLQSGTIVDCNPLHLLEQIEDGEIDHKILAVVDHREKNLPADAVGKIRTFIGQVFSHIPGKDMQLGRLLDAAAAQRYIENCRPN